PTQRARHHHHRHRAPRRARGEVREDRRAHVRGAGELVPSVAEALSRTADLEAADIPAPQVVAAARALVPDVARGIRSAPLTVEECAEAVREALGPARDTAA